MLYKIGSQKIILSENQTNIHIEARVNWDTKNVHWVLSYPELYEVGASNLGHIILYSIQPTMEYLNPDQDYT